MNYYMIFLFDKSQNFLSTIMIFWRTRTKDSTWQGIHEYEVNLCMSHTSRSSRLERAKNDDPIERYDPFLWILDRWNQKLFP